jgi:hypothetical protein
MSMPNHWMDQIVLICDKYHDDQIKLINEITKVMIDYKNEYKRFDDAVTADMNDNVGKFYE